MTENVMKILKLFESMTVISILESPKNYIVTICPKNVDPEDATGGMFAVDKKTFKISEFSDFSKPDEYKQARGNVLYKYNETPDDELTHWGIKGMKWGVRRYQNKDGSLTAAGKKRRAKLEAELGQLTRKKTASEMTDDELRERTTRMMMEANYYNAQKNLAAANPRKVSSGEKFVKSLMADVIAPAAKNAGRAWAEKFMKDKLGLTEQHKKSIDDQLKEFNLKTLKKGEALDDIRREIAILEAQKRLEAMREK